MQFSQVTIIKVKEINVRQILTHNHLIGNITRVERKMYGRIFLVGIVYVSVANSELLTSHNNELLNKNLGGVVVLLATCYLLVETMSPNKALTASNFFSSYIFRKRCSRSLYNLTLRLLSQRGKRKYYTYK